jgi:2-(1,2-epoxy-1,2-dihydrophenyl)acetyl-CoA isomerase
MSDNILEVTENSVAKVFLNSPKTSNAINSELLKESNKILVPISLDDKIRAVVITGRGKTFCAGGDLVKMSELPGGAVAGFYKLAAEFHKAVIEIYRMCKPVIAAINGPAVGAGLSSVLPVIFV